jgi:hypothetical protein
MRPGSSQLESVCALKHEPLHGVNNAEFGVLYGTVIAAQLHVVKAQQHPGSCVTAHWSLAHSSVLPIPCHFAVV